MLSRCGVRRPAAKPGRIPQLAPALVHAHDAAIRDKVIALIDTYEGIMPCTAKAEPRGLGGKWLFTLGRSRACQGPGEGGSDRCYSACSGSPSQGVEPLLY